MYVFNHDGPIKPTWPQSIHSPFIYELPFCLPSSLSHIGVHPSPCPILNPLTSRTLPPPPQDHRAAGLGVHPQATGPSRGQVSLVGGPPNQRGLSNRHPSLFNEN